MDCPGAGCVALLDDGMCVVDGVKDASSCNAIGANNTLWYNGSVCIATDVIDSTGCNEVSWGGNITVNNLWGGVLHNFIFAC